MVSHLLQCLIQKFRNYQNGQQKTAEKKRLKQATDRSPKQLILAEKSKMCLCNMEFQTSGMPSMKGMK